MKTALSPRPKSDTLCGNRFAPLQTAPKSTGAIQPSGNKTCRFLFATPNVVEKHTNNTHENKTMKSLTACPKVSTSLNKGYTVWKKNWEAFTIAGLLIWWTTTTCCCFYIFLAPPLVCGTMAMALVALRGGEIKGGGDVFLGFRKFFRLFFSQIVFGIIGTLGTLILCGIPLILIPLLPIMVLSMLEIADQDASFGQAIGHPFTQLGTKAFWSFFCVTLGACMVWMLGNVVLCIGCVVTIPIGICMLAAGYNDSLPEESAEAAA